MAAGGEKFMVPRSSLQSKRRKIAIMAGFSACANIIHSPSPLSISTSQSLFQFTIRRNQKSYFITRKAAPIAAVYHRFSTASVAGSWSEFAENVSGEWDGFGADFNPQSQPIELPESVVPEAFREWEVKVFDWQTQCPTLAQSDNNSPSLVYKTIKLLPTVGCEADAATRYETLERNVTAGHDSPFAYQSNGTYVALWPVGKDHDKSTTIRLLELEHCLLNPRDKESRVRIIQILKVQESELILQGIQVFVEQWYGPFRNGDQLGGCSIRDSAFAATQTLKAEKVSGAWQASVAVASFDSYKMIQHLGDGRVYKSIRDDEDSLVLLPKQLWCSLRRAENKETYCEVGWLFKEGRAITSKGTFSSSGQLKEIAIAHESAIPV